VLDQSRNISQLNQVIASLKSEHQNAQQENQMFKHTNAQFLKEHKDVDLEKADLQQEIILVHNRFDQLEMEHQVLLKDKYDLELRCQELNQELMQQNYSNGNGGNE